VPGIEDWSSLARSADADELRDHILTGFKSGKPFTPYTPTLELPTGIGDALDFGCGVGRNFSYLKTVARRVTGFDLQPMIARCRALATDRVDRLSDDWMLLRTERFDLIFASLVLQHVDPDACRGYLADFARMAPVVYLLTRTDSDFGVNVLDLVADSGAFDVGPCVHVDHNPDNHQLRVLGRATFADARDSRTSAHYETLLTPRSA
jgi:SAM-dependent methyltransferase